MDVNKPEKNYEVAEETPDTRYSRAEKIWDDRIGAAAVRAKNWRIAALSSLMITALAVGGMVYIGSQSKIVPYIVQVDSKSGAILSVAPTDKRTKANDQEIEFFLWNFTKKARSIPKDMIVYRANWEELYTYLDSATTNKINSMAISEGYQKKLKEGQTTLLKLKGFNRYSGQDNTYQVRWEESLYDASGKLMNVTSMEAFYTIEFIKVQSETIHINPLGLIIKDFSISEER